MLWFPAVTVRPEPHQGTPMLRLKSMTRLHCATELCMCDFSVSAKHWVKLTFQIRYIYCQIDNIPLYSLFVCWFVFPRNKVSLYSPVD